ncbi:MAG: hypothetical protein AAFV53_05055 [Myxococcota bacterium]
MDIWYRQDEGQTHFRVIYSEDNAVYLGNGVVGQPARWVGAPPDEGVSVAQVTAALARRAQGEGFEKIAHDELHLLLVQHAEEDLARRHAIEQALHNALVGHGLGYVDEGDIGMGKMTIWIHVTDPALAAPHCVQTLRDLQQLEGALIVTQAPGQEAFQPLWPANWSGEFSVR